MVLFNGAMVSLLSREGLGVVHWNAATSEVADVWKFHTDWGTNDEMLVPMRVSTLAAKDHLLVAGGREGQLAVKNVMSGKIVFHAMISDSMNPITNAVDLHYVPTGALRMMTSNNDAIVRMFDVETFTVLKAFEVSCPVGICSLKPAYKEFRRLSVS